MPSFSVGERVQAVGVTSPATGVIVEVCGDGRYRVEWQTDFLTEVVGAEEIIAETNTAR